MVAQRHVAPEAVLHPEGGVEDRIVLLRRSHFEPDAAQPCEGLQLRLGDMARLVVPDEIPAQSGLVNDQGREEQQEAQPDKIPPRKLRGSGSSRNTLGHGAGASERNRDGREQSRAQGRTFFLPPGALPGPRRSPSSATA